ncbi:hypothetical protein HPP92_000969 [Vanilla planifolia]|uniref:Uncharacterized protein n=1 Tax=Vanilla planifolia TaxID=51239 RepID=A0A835S2G2_VANPL|nr:hypothetical protein HPP92_000969 [Vanilla planifolia]
MDRMSRSREPPERRILEVNRKRIKVVEARFQDIFPATETEEPMLHHSIFYERARPVSNDKVYK